MLMQAFQPMAVQISNESCNTIGVNSCIDESVHVTEMVVMGFHHYEQILSQGLHLLSVQEVLTNLF